MNKFILILLFPLLLLSGCSIPKAQRQTIGSAYSKLLRGGDTNDVRLKLMPVGDYYEKIFLLACIELSEGNLDEARSYARRLVEMKPDIPDGNILAGLIERRSTYPEESWLISFASAWREENTPELYMFKKLFKWCDNNCSYNDTHSAIYESVQGTPDELLIAYTWNLLNTPNESVEISLKYSTPDTPVETRLMALAELSRWLWTSSLTNEDKYRLSDELRLRAELRRIELLRQFREDFPSLMIYDLLIFLEDTSEQDTFNDADIARLEAILNKDRLSLTGMELYRMYKAKYEKLGIRSSYSDAEYASRFSSGIFSLLDLKYKIRDTAKYASEKNRVRLANILDDIGKAQIKQRSFLDTISGLSYIIDARNIREGRLNASPCNNKKASGAEADLSQDDESKALKTLVNYFIKTATVDTAARFWPIQPLNIQAIEESIENEIEYLQLLTGKPIPYDISELLED